MDEKRKICGLDVLVATRDEAVEYITSAMIDEHPEIFGFCNAHTVNMVRKSSDFAAAVRACTLFNDGIGLDLASRVLYSKPFPENLNGTDLSPLILAGLPTGTKVFIIGSGPGVAAAARQVLAERFTNLDFVGARNGFFNNVEEPSVNAEIKQSGARFILAGMGHPRQECWAYRNNEELGAVILCVGAFLDFTVGKFRRAPYWVRSMRLEWLFRLILEPRRLAGRYLTGNVKFISHVLLQRVKHAPGVIASDTIR